MKDARTSSGVTPNRRPIARPIRFDEFRGCVLGRTSHDDKHISIARGRLELLAPDMFGVKPYFRSGNHLTQNIPDSTYRLYS